MLRAMSIRIATLLAALLPLPVSAQTAPAPPAAEARQDDLVRVALDTEQGRIVLALDRGRAPATVMVVTVEDAFLHCAKAVMRSHLWQPEHWPELGDMPSAADVAAARDGVQAAG